MKMHLNRGDGFYVRYLLIFASTFGSLLVYSAALAQETKSTYKVEPDNKYGEGGKRETTWNEAYHGGFYNEAWKDKDGRKWETYQRIGGDESWDFYKDGSTDTRVATIQ